MLTIGLTGGIGSGKSLAADYFKNLGITIIDSDKIAHQITQKNQPLYKKIIAHFGNSILLSNDEIDRKKLGVLIFNHKNDRLWLEQLLHPAIIAQMKTDITNASGHYCICVIPLLIEAKQKLNFIDRILVIDVPESLQIERTKVRDQLSEREIKNIMASQCSREQRLKAADDVIENTSDLSYLKNSVLDLHHFYLNLL